MNSNLIRVSTLNMPQSDWLKYRQNGLGGSDIATVMGLNKYKSSHQLFYEKVEGTEETPENIAMFMGKYMEDSIAELWSYWDGDVENMMKNFNEQKQVRKCHKVNAYLTNPDYPHLFASVDRIITKGDSGKEGILEIKTISGWVSEQWIGGIPPQYLVQLQQYLLITGLEYGEMAILKDGRYIDVLLFERNEEIIKNIIEQSSLFWKNVTAARELHKQELPIEHLEPSIDNTEAYQGFLNARFQATAIKAEPVNSILEVGLEYMDLNSTIKSIKARQDEITNKIKEHMREAELIDYNIKGKITWKADKNGKRTMRVDLKTSETIPA